MRKRIVITGMDVLSCIGNSLDDFWASAQIGKSGIGRIQSYDPEPYSTQIAGEIQNFCPTSIEGLEKANRLTRVTQYALHCAQGALRHSGIDVKDRSGMGVFVGTGWGGTPELESAFETFYKRSWKKLPPLSVLKAMPNSIANHLALHFNLQGPNVTISNACVSSAEAICSAAQQIAMGKLSMALCGGAESLIWEVVMAAWCRMRVMSTRNDDPQRSCKPFDADRDGMVIADGAAMLVLEDYEHAKARGATIYAELIGWAANCDASHITAPSTTGQSKAICSALDDARLGVCDVQYINAHGTGTLLNDITETQSIKDVFSEGAYDIPITALKSMTGHAIGAAGAMEIIATTMSLYHGVLLPTINLSSADPLCDLDYISTGVRNKTIDIAMSTHFAFGGANNVLILQRP